jgi:2-alkyl-3-oxoalkanoate reductase
MSILVTGASGFLGSHLVEHLCISGAKHLRCFVRPSSDLAKLNELRDKYPSTHLQYVVGNLLSLTDAYRAMEGIEVVYHLAAEMKGTAPTVFANTVVASRNILEAIIRHRVRRVVLVSSICVYGVAHLPRKTVVTEDTELETQPERRDAYAFAKIRQEKLFQQYRRNHSFELVILRPGVIYGEGRTELPSRAGLRLGPLLLQIAAQNRLPLTYVSNCVTAVALAGLSLPEGSYNVVDENPPKGAEYVRLYRSLVEKITSVRLSRSSVLLLAHIFSRWVALSRGQIPAVLTPYQIKSTWGGHRFSNERLRAAGWNPRASTAEGILRTFETSNCPTQPRKTRQAVMVPPPSPLASSEN